MARQLFRSPLIAAPALLLAALAFSIIPLSKSNVEKRYGEIIHETTSDFSRIRIREKGPVRSLLFIDKNGKEQCQSSVNTEAPGEHQLGYTRSLFASFLFHYPQNRVLIVGLGGGGMVRFLNSTFPTMMVEAVEIDPVVVQLAAEYFGTRPGPRTKIHTEDAFVFLNQDHGLYDAIYMDAFLQPPAGSGLKEKTRRLKTLEFLISLQDHLTPDGMVAFNIIPAEEGADENISAINEAFTSTFAFDVPRTGNRIIIACKEETIASPEQLSKTSRDLDESLDLHFSFQEIAKALRHP
ncbi:MAG: fused MFS/spermidine synthase [Verrucomicrobiales bacterium]|nr:fused MFS/spermidine synthase [Verrucomicrobiales bacterium]